MRSVQLGVFLAGMMLVSPVPAQSPAGEPTAKPIPADLAPHVETSVRRGNLLYAYDQAAWHGTDEFLARHKALQGREGGYVVTGTLQQTVLVFYDKAKREALFRATFNGSKMINAGQPNAGSETLTPMELRMIRARELAFEAFVASKVSICTKGKANVAVLPPETPGGPVTAYLMSPQVDLNVLPLGGHYSVTVSEDGKTGPVRKFTNTCVNLPLSGTDGKGGKLAALSITHLLDPVPTELHVFSSLTGRKPIYVLTTTNRRIWNVRDGTVGFVSTLDDQKR